MSKLGAFIKFHREKRGLSQEAFGALCGGVSRSAVSQWEKGGNIPDADRLPIIAKALGLPPEVFEYRLESVLLAPGPNELDRHVPLLDPGLVLAHVDHSLDASACNYEDYVRVYGDIGADCYAVTVEGNDLANDVGILPGDLVVMDPGEQPRDNDIVHAVIDDALCLRVYRYRGRDRAGQPAYDLFATDPEISTKSGNSLSPIRIVSVMVEHRRKRRLSTPG